MAKVPLILPVPVVFLLMAFTLQLSGFSEEAVVCSSMSSFYKIIKW
jgi:hypothetical protein